MFVFFFVFFCQQKTAYERRISDWSSDVCSSDLGAGVAGRDAAFMVGESSRSVVARRFAASSLGQLCKPFLELCQQAPTHFGLARRQILLFHWKIGRAAGR